VPGSHRVVDRYYDPATDQFLSVDPDVAETGEPYAFTGDDPLNATDPLGMSALFNFLWRHGYRIRGKFPKLAGEDTALYRVNSEGYVTAYAEYNAKGDITKRVDLDPDSAPHLGVEAPHSHSYSNNVSPEGKVYPKESDVAEPATEADVLTPDEQNVMASYQRVIEASIPDYDAPTALELGERLGWKSYPRVENEMDLFDPLNPTAVDDGNGTEGIGDVAGVP
jgi:hypothetical protein